MVTFRKQYFNPLYFIINELAKDETIRTVLIYGGKSSAKTVSIAQFLTKECYVKEANTIAFRKESNIIKTTLKKSFNLAINSMYLYPVFERLDMQYRCNNDCEIILKGLDDSEKAKGVESYKYVYLDELNHFKESEYEQFNLSLRGIPGQKIFASWNPVDENSWVKTNLVDKYEFVETEFRLPCENSFVKKSTCGKVVLIKTTYEDNYWIVGSPDKTYGYVDQNLIDEYNALKSKNYNSYKVNVLGEWGKTVFGGEFLKCWRSETHAAHFPYDPKQAIYLSFDENVNPYFPCGFFQVGPDQKSPRLIHEIAAKNPNNTTAWMGREITRKLMEWGHKEHLYVGGDATSKKEDVKQEKGHDLFRVMCIELNKFRPIRKVATSNPSVRDSSDFFNLILEGGITGMSFGADLHCRTAIADYENTKEDKNGHVDKKTIIDTVSGVSYQPWGHFVDLTRYFIVDTFREEYLNYLRGDGTLKMVVGKKRFNDEKRY